MEHNHIEQTEKETGLRLMHEVQRAVARRWAKEQSRLKNVEDVDTILKEFVKQGLAARFAPFYSSDEIARITEPSAKINRLCYLLFEQD